jgi:hypothetical protein
MSKKNAAALVVEDVYNSFSDDEIDLDNKATGVKNAVAKNAAARSTVSFFQHTTCGLLVYTISYGPQNKSTESRHAVICLIAHLGWHL